VVHLTSTSPTASRVSKGLRQLGTLKFEVAPTLVGQVGHQALPDKSVIRTIRHRCRGGIGIGIDCSGDDIFREALTYPRFLLRSIFFLTTAQVWVVRKESSHRSSIWRNMV